MGAAVTAKELRRETKRTLGHKLQEFAGDQHTRLKTLEERVGELLPHDEKQFGTIGMCASLAATNGRAAVHALEQSNGSGELVNVGLLETQVRALMEIRHRGFFGRLNWALFGR